MSVRESAERRRKYIADLEPTQFSIDYEKSGQCAEDADDLADAWIEQNPADDDLGPDAESLEKLGFNGSHDEDDADVYDLDTCPPNGPTVRVYLVIKRGEIVRSGMSLHWRYPGSPVSLCCSIMDDPTIGDVRKLLSALRGE